MYTEWRRRNYIRTWEFDDYRCLWEIPLDHVLHNLFLLPGPGRSVSLGPELVAEFDASDVEQLGSITGNISRPFSSGQRHREAFTIRNKPMIALNVHLDCTCRTLLINSSIYDERAITNLTPETNGMELKEKQETQSHLP